MNSEVVTKQEQYRVTDLKISLHLAVRVFTMTPAFKAKTALVAAIFLQTGCAGPTWTGREFQDIQPLREGNGALYIYAPRTGMPVLGQMSSKIFIDNQSAVTIDEGYFTRLQLPPGTYRFHASSDSQIACGGQISPGIRYEPIDITVAANETYALRYSSHPEVRKATTCDRHLRIIDQTTADKELKTLKEAENSYH